MTENPADPVSAHIPSGNHPRLGADGPNSTGTHDVIESHLSRGAGGPSSHDAQRLVDSPVDRGVVGPPSPAAPMGEVSAILDAAPLVDPTGPVSAQGVLVSHETDGADGPTPPGSPTAHSTAIEVAAEPEVPSSPAAHIVGSNAKAGAAPLGDPTSPVSAQRVLEDHIARGADGPTSTGTHDAIASHGAYGSGGFSSPAAPTPEPAATGRSAPLVDPFLALAADVVTDLESVRIANENRLRQLTRPADQLDADGGARGFGLDESNRDVARLAAIVESMAAAEHQATLNLSRLMRVHPLGPWVARNVGVGEKQAARLLAVIGDPAWNSTDETPRTLRQLYSYSGYGDAAKQVRRRGVQVSWNADARMRTRMIADSCVRQERSPFRAVYDEGRERYADAKHNEPCVRCGPSGHPADAGTPLSLAHQDGRARRLVCKAILRDLWREARALHGWDDEVTPDA